MKRVAPLAGAWIETYASNTDALNYAVAPLAGAWIETDICILTQIATICRTPRGCVD